MRKGLRRTVVLIVLVLIGGVGVLVGHSMWQQRQHSGVPAGFELIPGVSQHIQDFHRVKVHNGRQVWEISAKDARYFKDDETIVVRAPVMRLFLKDGRVVGLQGDEARILMDGHREIRRVELRGNIEVDLADYKVRTDSATYDHAQEQISTPGAVEISGRGLQLRGDQMVVAVQSERLTLLHHVAMRFQPALLRQGGAHAPL